MAPRPSFARSLTYQVSKPRGTRYYPASSSCASVAASDNMCPRLPGRSSCHKPRTKSYTMAMSSRQGIYSRGRNMIPGRSYLCLWGLCDFGGEMTSEGENKVKFGRPRVYFCGAALASYRSIRIDVHLPPAHPLYNCCVIPPLSVDHRRSPFGFSKFPHVTQLRKRLLLPSLPR